MLQLRAVAFIFVIKNNRSKGEHVRRNTIRSSKLFYDPKIFNVNRWTSTTELNNRIIEEIKKFNVYNATIPIFQLASSNLLPKLFIPIYDSNTEHYDVSNASGLLTTKNYIYWIIGLFFGNADLLKAFNNTRKKINSSILNGTPEKALTLIDDLNIRCKSWWAVQFKLHILKEFNLGDTRDYLEKLPTMFPRANIKNKISELLLISESSSYEIFTREFLLRMDEYRSSCVQSAIDAGAVESLKYLPPYMDSKRTLSLDLIKLENYESLIDQYIFLKEIILEDKVLDSIPIDLKSLLLELSELVEDNELRILVNDDSTTKENIQEITDLYTMGCYEDAKKNIDSLITNTNDEYYGLIEILTRTKIYLNETSSEDTLLNKITTNFSRILQCDKNTLDSLDFLKSICFKFKLESWAKSLTFHLLSTLEEIVDLDDVESARKQTRILGELNTSKARIKNFSPKPSFSVGGQLPEYRALKYGKNDTSEVLVDSSIIPIKSDFIKTQCRYFIENNKFTEAIDFCIDKYLSNTFTSLYLPIATLCRLVTGIDKNDNDIFISSLVIYDIMARVINNNYEDTKTDLFEEFMDFNKTHRPSKIFETNQFSAKEEYFLKYICIPSQLDNFTDYVSNDDVVHERIAILDLLINAKSINEEQIKKEKDSVLENLFSEKLRAKIESGKLYVDVHSLVNKRKHIYQNLFEQAIETKGGILLSPLDESKGINSEDLFEIAEGNAVASSKKMEMLFTIFRNIVADFALDENYGLDKYLSAEIRHIVFTTQIRSCFEKTHLVTIKKEGEYLSNVYWTDKYSYVNNHIVSKFDELLGRFSEKIDNLLHEVNENFRVEISDLKSKHVFNYIAYHHRLVRVSEIITNASDYEEFFSDLIDYMWEITAENARSAQDKLNDYLAPEILIALDLLEEGINSVKRDAAIIELTQEIKNARTLFKKEIELVLNWFRFVGSDDINNYEKLSVVLEATMSSFEEIYGHKYQSPIYEFVKNDLTLNYRESRSLFISLFTALENACKYAHPDTKVYVSHDNSGGVNTIKIINKLNIISQDEAQQLIVREKSKWNEKFSSLSTKEGGSGLYKIYSTLKNSSDGYCFDIETSDNYFISLFRLKNEYFNHRRQSIKA